MKPYRNTLFLTCVVLAAAAPLASAQDGDLMTQVAAKTDGAIALVRCNFDPASAVGTAIGQAICIDESGLFLAVGFNSGMRNAEVEQCQILPAGTRTDALDAKLEHIDRHLGLAIVRCTDEGAPKWQAVQFAGSSDITIGETVVSTGVMPGEPGNTQYFGLARVSALLEVPEPIAYVTGGNLTCAGSVVFDDQARAVGLVLRQLSHTYEMTTDRGRANVALKPTRESSSFTLVEDFIEVVKDPETPREMSWTGIGEFQPVDEEVLELGRPAVRIAKVVPGLPAARAGLKDLDVIVQVNGENIEELATPALTAVGLERKLLRMPVGENVSFTLDNGRTVSFALMAMPERPFEAPRYLSRELGALFREKVMLDQYLNTELSHLKSPGILVLSVGQDSPAAKAGLQTQDLITSVNAQPVSTVDTLRQILQKAQADALATLPMMVDRGGQTQSITVEMP